jgi:TRAP-type uncharacterized transport system fused permease subunit
MTPRKENKRINPIIALITSLFIPGLGQLLSRKFWRGIAFFAITLICAFLTNWAFVHVNIGKIQIGSITTTWLWLPMIILWLWNVLDSLSIARGTKINLLPAVLCAGIILYVVAWKITNVNLTRMVNDFGDMKTILTQIANPDLDRKSVV